MPSEALCQFVQLGRSSGVIANEEGCQDLQTRLGFSSGLLILWVPCGTRCYCFFLKPPFRQRFVFRFPNHPHCTRNERCGAVDPFWAILLRFNLAVSQGGSLKEQSQYQSGLGCSWRRAFLAACSGCGSSPRWWQGSRSCCSPCTGTPATPKAKQGLRTNCKVTLKADVPQLQGEVVMEAVNSERGGWQQAVTGGRGGEGRMERKKLECGDSRA